MKQLTTYFLTLITLGACQKNQTPPIEGVLVEYVDDIKHLMTVNETDSVIWILQSNTRKYDFNQFDTVYRLEKRSDTVFTKVKGRNGNQKYVYDSLGLPIFFEDMKFDSKKEITWILDNNRVLRVEKPSSLNSADTTFYTFKNGRVESRFEKKGDNDFEYATYQYNSSGRLTSIVDTMIYPINHHYHKYTKELIWQDSRIKQVNEVFTPGKRKTTFFDIKGFPNKIVEIFESGDTVIFEIKKL